MCVHIDVYLQPRSPVLQVDSFSEPEEHMLHTQQHILSPASWFTPTLTSPPLVTISLLFYVYASYLFAKQVHLHHCVQIPHISDVMRCSSFWLTLLSTTSFRSTCVCCKYSAISFLFTVEQSSAVYYEYIYVRMCIYMYTHTHLFPSINGHLGCFYLSAIVNNCCYEHQDACIFSKAKRFDWQGKKSFSCSQGRYRGQLEAVVRVSCKLNHDLIAVP